MGLIDAEELKKELLSRAFFPTLVKHAIEKCPTVDAVEVVRCKGCKHWRPDDDIGHCENPDGLDNYALPNDFCSYGERKNDGK